MKWFLLLIIACSHQKAPTPSPTESDARVITPQELPSCLCAKIFKPVCAGGVNYGNECEAKCQGHEAWSEGSCK